MQPRAQWGDPPPLDGVRRIAVLRPNAVGDFVFALPALHALKQAYPEARLTLVGKAWHRDFLAGRPGPVDDVAVMPSVPGVGAEYGGGDGGGGNGDGDGDGDAVDAFVARMREQSFDLALQMYGGGRHSNAFLQRFGARLSVGARARDAAPLDRWLPYREPVPRRLALLEIAALAGAPPVLPPLPELALVDADRADAAAALPAVPGERLAILQPGASDPRRRWPASCFAALGDRLAQQGLQVAINGSPGEAALVAEVASGMRHRAVPLAGRLGLHGLCGLLARARLLVSNDTGPLHLALALGVPSVGIFWLTNLVEGMPLRPSLLHAALSLRTCCPVCGRDNVALRCPHDASFVADVRLDEVALLADRALAGPSAGMRHQ